MLFRDEIVELAWEVLRQPLEDGVVHVSRVSASYTYPADFWNTWRGAASSVLPPVARR